ncbi:MULTISPECIES: putative toxin-antitoxin system toxin component, PIN family [unclassified Spirosoma]|uniref:putative toxin-antitoxin system toxin component, PIN family n=1 Tax=unclassified Spirosoma TaxID=2621999 RepID=UPI0009669055|nr:MULTISPECIES: putative toxin-antitoxin system toxin component, PIN family [unclassified Spirosoma]MBN8822400.1 putative toxin-antitoxin system toxin component, PIN family [Spirosoma sp.]OJW73733.1 MAG: putative toxin-antitoxin system toxin component, PIN family [Spirosoma sp. 48-14]
MRIVIDTNCLLVSIPKIAKSRWLFDAILAGIVEMAVTTDILEEYEEIIGTFYNSPTLAKNVLETLANRPNVLKVSPYYFWSLITEDPDDNKFVDCAVACGADFLITEDSHYKILETIPFPRIPVRTRAQFQKILFPDN